MNVTISNDTLKASLAIAATATGAVFLSNAIQKRAKKNTFQKVGRVVDIMTFPVKGMRGVHSTSAMLTRQGLVSPPENGNQLDRCFVVYHEESKDMCNSKLPYSFHNVLVQCKPIDERTVELSAPGVSSITVRPTENEVEGIRVSRVECVGAFDCGDEAAEWITKYVGYISEETGQVVRMRIAYFDKEHSLRDPFNKLDNYMNLVQKSYPANVSTPINFSDMVSLNLFTTQSLAALNSAMADHGSTQFDNHAFRANVVIESLTSDPWQEDNWDQLYIGTKNSNMPFENVMGCQRCVMPSIDPDTGRQRADGQPTKWLMDNRMYDFDKELYQAPVFGIHLGPVVEDGHVEACNIKIGDFVYAKLK